MTMLQATGAHGHCASGKRLRLPRINVLPRLATAGQSSGQPSAGGRKAVRSWGKGGAGKRVRQGAAYWWLEVGE